MATQKRRIVYLTDEDWEDLRFQATDRGLTISEFVRQKLLVPSSLRPVGDYADLAERPTTTPLVTGPKTAHLLRRYPEFRPVPKPSQRK